jgi:nitric oxide reductase subunit B
MALEQSRQLLISRGWTQAIAIVMIFGFTVMGMLAYLTYTGKPPIPVRVTDPSGHVLFTRSDILAGQGVFLRNGLMEYGSIFGHGAYLGPDFTADYLHRAALSVMKFYGGESSDRAKLQTVADFKNSRYDSSADMVIYTPAQVHAFEQLCSYYGEFFGDPTTKYGLRPNAIRDPEQIFQLTAFFSWSAWASSALRPGQQYSYTNNWPPEPLVENRATPDAIVWSVLSLIALLGGIGLLFAAFGRWNFLGWHGREQQTVSFRPPNQVLLTPAQRACAWFFLVMGLLFLLQTLVGGASQHYRAEISNFFGTDCSSFAIQHRPHVALAACDFLGFDFLPCCRDLSGADDCWPRTARPKHSRVWSFGRSSNRGLWKLAW